MASIQSSGLNLDVQSLAAQLVAADRAPMDARLSRQEQTLSVQMSGLGSLKGALSSFQTALQSLKTVSAFTVLSASVADEDYYTASAESGAAPGNYDIQVLDLAKANQLASGAFAAPDTVVGTGALTIGQGAGSFTVNIDSTNNTLTGIRDAINDAADNTGVRATLIHEQNGTHLVLSATKTGAANAIKITTTGGDGGLAGLAYDPQAAQDTTKMHQVQPAQDAHITVAGFDHYSATNTVDDAIDGVTLTLTKQTEEDTPVALTISNDNTTVSNNVQSFVNAFNQLQRTFASLRSYNATSGQTGALFGDALLRQVEDQMRLDLSSPVSGLASGFNSLAAVGITRQTDGTLAVDTTKLNKAIADGNGAVAQLFGSTNGIAARIDAHITSQLATGSAFDYRNTSITAGLKDITNQRADLDARMTLQQQRYVQQFSALDAMLSQMQQTSSYLSQQLASIPTAG